MAIAMFLAAVILLAAAVVELGRSHLFPMTTWPR
jgi:hypothetical protein